MSTLGWIAIIILGMILISIFIVAPEYNRGWIVKYREKCGWMPYSVYYDGEFVERFDTLEEAKEYIKRNNSENDGSSSDDEGKIVYREL